LYPTLLGDRVGWLGVGRLGHTRPFAAGSLMAGIKLAISSAGDHPDAHLRNRRYAAAPAVNRSAMSATIVPQPQT